MRTLREMYRLFSVITVVILFLSTKSTEESNITASRTSTQAIYSGAREGFIDRNTTNDNNETINKIRPLKSALYAKSAAVEATVKATVEEDPTIHPSTAPPTLGEPYGPAFPGALASVFGVSGIIAALVVMHRKAVRDKILKDIRELELFEDSENSELAAMGLVGPELDAKGRPVQQPGTSRGPGPGSGPGPIGSVGLGIM